MNKKISFNAIKGLLLGVSLFSFLSLQAGPSAQWDGETPLAVVSQFQAATQDNQIFITWTSFTQEDHRFFTIERAGMNMQFEEISKVNSKDSQEAINYRILDTEPASGPVFYRLVSTDAQGVKYYHGIITK